MSKRHFHRLVLCLYIFVYFYYTMHVFYIIRFYSVFDIQFISRRYVCVIIILIVVLKSGSRLVSNWQRL